MQNDEVLNLTFHTQKLSELLKSLKTKRSKGLVEEEAAKKLIEVGPNTLKDPPSPSCVGAFIGEFFGLLQLLLWIAAAFYFVRYFVGPQDPRDV